MHVGLISLEPWDQVWRRNQHLTMTLLEQGLVARVTFVEPPLLGARPTVRRPVPGVRAVRPLLPLPKRYGGLAMTGWLLKRTALRDVDVLWVNDATLGVQCLRHGVPVLHDVTDDWREGDFPPHVRQRIVAAEDALAHRARTVVCSAVLQRRWSERYGVAADVVHNGVSGDWVTTPPRDLSGPGPHIGYVGTLHEGRLDVPLLLELADADAVGSVHLVGPDGLGPSARALLSAHPKVVLHGPQPSGDVPGWTKAMDVLISPHVVTPFTLSLDAIKSYEYVASGRPVVATPTSGFQLMRNSALRTATRDRFVDEVVRSIGRVVEEPAQQYSWAARARDMAAVLATLHK